MAATFLPKKTMFGGLSRATVEPMQIDTGPDDADINRTMVENTTLDLEAYAGSYTGLAKLLRLMHIASRCRPLRIDALRLALTHVQTTHNVIMYQNIHKQLMEAINNQSRLPDGVPAASIPALDVQWIETTQKRAALKVEKLDMDLKNYKSNSIKESIRRGHDDLGDHYLDCGDLANALKCYSRARDYCTTARHLVNMCLNVIKVSIYLQNWTHVTTYVSKAETTSFLTEPNKEGNQAVVTKLNIASGLGELMCNKYKAAARLFLSANLDHCDFPELISPNNIATYGTLCALATFDRQEIQRLVLNSSSFKLFLELEPQLRDVVYKLHNSQYASSLKLLDAMKDNFVLDLYLASHVEVLYSQIRNRALCQYFSPYLSADMRKMAESFNTTVTGLEEELMQLILEGKISARIDSHNKVLYAKDLDQRSITFEKAFAMGEEYQMRSKALVLRAAVVKNQIQVKSNATREGSQEAMMGTAMNSSWGRSSSWQPPN
jgi:COP9 signalosome complex subunit 1